MTDSEWSGTTDLHGMMEFVRGEASERRLRLFACACCRLRWHLLTHPDSRRAVEVAEQYADGLATPDELRSAGAAAVKVAGPPPDFPVEFPAEPFDSSSEMAWAAAHTAAYQGLSDRVLDALNSAALVWVAVWHTESPRPGEPRPVPDPKTTVRQTQADLIRDIWGNPVRPPAVAPDWRTSTVLALAGGIYRDRAFDRLPVLADALMDAGCDHEAMLDHCRGDGIHTRGCWVVDLLLGKE